VADLIDMKRSDEGIRWGLWSDPKTWEDVAVHAQAVRGFMALVGGNEVTL
jgi:cold shock CspA family protein